MAFCRSRTTNLVSSERFQALMNVAAGAIDELGVVPGKLMHELLDRPAEILGPVEEEEVWQRR